MDIYVDVLGHRLRLASNERRFPAGTQNFIRYLFRLSDEWVVYDKVYAQFSQGDLSYRIELDERNSACLPPDIKKGRCDLVLIVEDGDVIAKTLPVELLIAEDPNRAVISDSQIILASHSIATLDEVREYLNI